MRHNIINDIHYARLRYLYIRCRIIEALDIFNPLMKGRDCTNCIKIHTHLPEEIDSKHFRSEHKNVEVYIFTNICVFYIFITITHGLA